ncbi:MAG: leucyl aminopeptidase [Acidimicrobiales bacterium]|jgi:leucyl aminopeptidase
MKIESTSAYALPGDLVAVAIPVFAGKDGPQPASGVASDIAGADAPAVLDAEWCKRQGFTGKVGQTLVFRVVASATSRLPAFGTAAGAPEPASRPDTVLVGLGEAGKLVGDAGRESLRRAAAAFVRAAGEGEAAAFFLPSGLSLSDAVAAEAVAEGAVLAGYRYDTYRTGERPGVLGRLVITTESPAEAPVAARGGARGARIAQSVSLARSLVNEPASSLTPQRFAESFVRRFRGVPGLSIEVWDEERIASERLGGLLAVARGSTQPPRLVKVSYQPTNPIDADGRVPHLALVGKGITFDSGGLSLKTAGGMESMKTDMGGAAAVLGAVDAIAVLGARIRVTALTPLTENMPGGSATKPGDVVTARNGKTIEVLNTDAEGRLILADALSLAAETDADAIVDVATLTGAAVVALGKEIAGLMGNDERLMEEVRLAGGRAGEPLWPLPLPDDYRCHIDSDFADMRNVGRTGQAGSIAAALLLREFVGTVPWAHLDIAGPARSDDSVRYLTKGGTGFGVRTLVELATSEQFARSLVRRPDR